jgi:NAD(P)-dependent dehydrogenase (short-subunit alcohol dehydrogenase family)
MGGKNAIRTYEGAVCVITGGGSGIGRSLGTALAARGAHVVLADYNERAAQSVAQEIAQAGGSAQPALLDVRDADAFKQLIDSVKRERGRIDYLFNNAGIGVCGPIEEFTAEHWTSVIDIDLMGVVNGIRAIVPVMLEQGFGHIVNTSSADGLTPIPLVSSYTASKFGVFGLTLSLRTELFSRGVRATALCPGVIRTPLLYNEGHGNDVLFDLPRETYDKAWARLRPMDPDKFAQKVLKKLARNASVIIEPAWWRMGWWLFRLSPDLTMWFNRKFVLETTLKEFRAAEAEHKAQK